MIRLKDRDEIEAMAEGGQILAEVLQQVVEAAKPGVTTRDLDLLARDLLKERGVKPSFLKYEGFPAALCVSVNNNVVHGMPREEALKEGDLVGLDLGLIYEGLYLDHARTVAVGEISGDKKKLLDVTRKALEIGISKAQAGNRIGDIGAAIQKYVEGASLGVVKQLVGHGVGYAVHEEPKVPNFGEPGTGPVMKPGLVIAIEPMVTIGRPEVQTANDGWTVETVDGSLAAHEEHTVAVTEAGPRILTGSSVYDSRT